MMNAMNIQELLGSNQGLWLTLAVLWSLPWKGVALWKAAHREEKWWFVALLIVNTLGLLEIAYIFLIARDRGVEKVYKNN